MVRVYLALYKGKAAINTPRDVVKRIADKALYDWQHAARTAIVKSLLSTHATACLIVIRLARDGGVRIKTMPLPADKWDLIPLPQSVAISASRLFHRTHGAGYDWLGAIGVVLKSPHSKSRWFCSEWCAYVIGYTNPCRYSPQNPVCRGIN